MAGEVAGQRATLTPVTSQESFNSLTASTPDTTLKVIYFAAPWAAPCAQMSTVLSTLASTYTITTPPQLIFLSVDTDDHPDIAEQYDVTAVPYVVLQRGNQTLETISGSDPSKVRLAVEKHAGAGSAGANQLPPAQSVARPANQPAVNGGQLNGTTQGAAGAAATSGAEPSASPAQEEDLNSRLEKLVKAAPVMLFMKGSPSAPQCGFSRQLVGILRENGVRYGFFNILADEDVRQGLKAFADWPTFPQLWIDGELVGGLDIVKEELENDADFFAQYSVNAAKKDASNAPTAEQQPQVAAA